MNIENEAIQAAMDSVSNPWRSRWLQSNSASIRVHPRFQNLDSDHAKLAAMLALLSTVSFFLKLDCCLSDSSSVWNASRSVGSSTL